MASPSRPPFAVSTRRSSKLGSSPRPAAASSTSALPHVASARKQSGASASSESPAVASPLKRRLESDLRAAMKSGDTFRRDTLRFLLAGIQREGVDRLQATIERLVAEGKDEASRQSYIAEHHPSDLDDIAVLEVLQKQAKMRRDSTEAFRKGDRPELAAKEERELGVIQSYLPTQMSDAELRAIVERVVAETGAAGPRDMGKVMPKVLAQTKDRADGKKVANIDRIEREFAVKIVSRGAELRIMGDPANVARVGELVSAMRTLSDRDDNLRKPALERLIDEAKDAPVGAPEQLREVVATTVRGKRITPQSANQRSYVEAIRNHDLVFATGPAGTGKSYLAVALGVAALRDRKVARLILTRPAVEAGERLGFLPGDLTEKIDPYLRPLYDALYELMPPERFTRAMERGEIEVAPLAFMRGRSLNEAFIILDEAQNATPAQMKMFLTRLGYGAQAVVNGDITQVDLEKDQRSGLVVAREILKDVEGIAFVDFNERDVVRHELVARIVRAYDRYEKK